MEGPQIQSQSALGTAGRLGRKFHDQRCVRWWRRWLGLRTGRDPGGLGGLNGSRESRIRRMFTVRFAKGCITQKNSGNTNDGGGGAVVPTPHIFQAIPMPFPTVGTPKAPTWWRPTVKCERGEAMGNPPDHPGRSSRSQNSSVRYASSACWHK